MTELEFMGEACKEADRNLELGFKEGGPFGTVIVKDGEIIARGKNNVLAHHDPTAHAEVSAIREAGKVLGTHDLKGCVLFTSCYPCPMCLSAIIWSNITEVYYGNTKEDAAEIGFRDDFIYDVLSGKTEMSSIIGLKPLGREVSIGTFHAFAQNKGTIY